MADATELKNMVRLGTVMSVDKEKMTARVKFKDKGGITSSPTSRCMSYQKWKTKRKMGRRKKRKWNMMCGALRRKSSIITKPT